MIPGLKPYPEMKHSGVDALGPVPAHWEVAKLGHIGRLFKGNGASKEDEVPTGVPCIRYGDLYTRHNYFILDSRACISEERASDYSPIEFGDILFAASGETIDEIGKSAVNLIQGRAYCGGDVIVFRPKRRLDCGYMGYATDFRPAAIQKARMGRGFTVVHIYGDLLKKLAVPLPPVQEQSDIVRFLEHIDRRIQRYIDAKQKLIALLAEQKQAIIHQAVTGRIDVRTGQPYPVYTPSGVEWLGDIPAHWSLAPNRSHLRRRKILVGEKHTEYELLSLTKNGIVVRDISSGRGKFSADMGTCQEVRRGDLVFCLFDVPETPRTVGLSSNNGMITGAYTVFECDGIELRSYLEALYIAMDDRKLLSPIYSGLRNTIPPSRFLGVKSPIPPKEEQAEILNFLADADERYVRTMAQARHEIGLLEEYRTRLVADVVTGKLDVRAAEGKLPAVDSAVDYEGGLPYDADFEPNTDQFNATLDEPDA